MYRPPLSIMKREPDWTYDLHIFGTDPKRMPMDALADIMKRLSDLLGSPSHLRFRRLRGGSAALLVDVEEPARAEVRSRLVTAKLEAKQSVKVQRLNDALGNHGWRAELRLPDGRIALDLPGAANEPVSLEQTVRQHDSLLGTVIKIGGKDDTVPMTIQTPGGEYIDVTVKGRELARKLAKLIFDKEVRVYGTTTWSRDSKGNWSCENMLVENFDEPDATALEALFDELRGIPGNGWNEMDDPAKQYRNWKSEEDE